MASRLTLELRNVEMLRHFLVVIASSPLLVACLASPRQVSSALRGMACLWLLQTSRFCLLVQTPIRLTSLCLAKTASVAILNFGSALLTGCSLFGQVGLMFSAIGMVGFGPIGLRQMTFSAAVTFDSWLLRPWVKPLESFCVRS
jgi:hypothetical protein